MKWVMRDSWKTFGLVAAGVSNIAGVLICSRFFTNSAINEADPVVMSDFGLLMIVIWGLAYIAAATIRSNIMWLAAAFAIEKLVYGLAWLNWLSDHDLAPLYANDFLAGLFFSIYGLNDFAFMLFFLWLFVSERTSEHR
jgi:hypothetical protein